MLEQDSLEGSGTQGQGRAATAAQVSGLGDARQELLARGDFPVPWVWQWVTCVGNPPSPQLWGLQQWPLKEWNSC